MTERETDLLRKLAFIYDDVRLDHWAATVDAETGTLSLGDAKFSEEESVLLVKESAEVRRQLEQTHSHIAALFQTSKLT